MDTKYITIDAVLDRDLLSLLEKLDLVDRINAAEILCAKCDKVITLENIGAIGIADGKVEVYCNDFGCIGEGEQI